MDQSNDLHTAVRVMLDQQTVLLQALTSHHQKSSTSSADPSNSREAPLNISVPLFHGRKGENVDTWIFQVEEAFKARRTPTKYWINYAANLLGDAALQWYFNRIRASEQGLKSKIEDWDTLTSELHHSFEPPNNQQILRRELMKIRQNSSVQDYVYQFRNLLGQIDLMSELDQIQYFINGLKEKTKMEVNYRGPRFFEEAVQIAISFDSAMYGLGRPVEWNTDRTKSFHNKLNHHDPMDLSIIDKKEYNKYHGNKTENYNG